MSTAPEPLRHLLASGKLRWSRSVAQDGAVAAAAAEWGFAAIAGRMVELCGQRQGPSALLTTAACLVADAQRSRENVSWVALPAAPFYPPDLTECGVDLDALVVVRVEKAPDKERAALRAAECLLRSGAFGLVVVEVGAEVDVPMPAQVRLRGLAQRHDAALVVVRSGFRASVRGGRGSGVRSGAQSGARGRRADGGSLFSLRAESALRRDGKGRFACRLQVVKDKRRGGGWTHEQVVRGAMGLR